MSKTKIQLRLAGAQLKEAFDSVCEAMLDFAEAAGDNTRTPEAGVKETLPIETSAKKTQADTKKAIAAAQKIAKAAASKVLKEEGKEALVQLLASQGAKQFGDIPSTVEAYGSLTSSADVLIKAAKGATDDDDLLNDAPAVTRTMEDLKSLLLKVNDNKKLGREVTRQILADFGATGLVGVKAEDYGAAYLAAEAALEGAKV